MDEGIVCIAEVAGTLEGEFLRSLLEAHEIPVMLSSESAGAAYRVTVGSLARTQVFVPARLAAQAREILAQAQGGSEASPSDEDGPETKG